MQQYVYIVFSATPYWIGKAIRAITAEQYNHVSIALDEDLTRMYGFARRYYRTPLYGGFVRESRSRYHINGKSTDICLCRLPVSEQQYQALEQHLTGMHQEKEQYIYNHLSILGAPFRKPIQAKHCYTCVEFCVERLAKLGIDADPKQYYSVGDLAQLLQPYVIYTGPMPADSEVDRAFFAKKPVPHPTMTTLRELWKLIPRLHT